MKNLNLQKEVDSEIQKLKSDFSKLRKKKHFTVQDEDRLIEDVTGLLGLYSMVYEEDLRHLISEMLEFGQSKRWALEGEIFTFEKLNKKYNL